MYFSGKPYFTGNRDITTISEKRTDTQKLKPKSRKKGKSTRKKKAKQKYNLTQLKKQLGNDMVIKLLLRLVEGKAGARPVGRPPQQIPSTKQPRKMRLARGSGLPPKQKQKLEKKKQGETEQQFFKRVEDYVMDNNPAFLYFSQMLQQDRQRAEALIREQINSIRNQPVIIREAQEREADVDKDFINDLLRRLRVAEGSSSIDRQKIVREGLKQYSQETGDRLVSSDEDFFYDLARTRGKKKRQEAESRIQQRFVKTGAPRRKARKRVVEEERTTTLGELGGDKPFTQAEQKLQEGFTTDETTSGGEALSRFQQSGSFRRPPDNPYDRGSSSDIPTSPDEEAERLQARGVGRPKFAESGRETKAQRKARLRAEEERRRLEEQGFTSTSESSVGLDKPIKVVKTEDLPRQPEPERQPESGSEVSFPASIRETPADPSELAQKVRQAERERRFAPLQQADTGEIEPTATEATGKVGSKSVARTGRTPGIQGKQKSLVDAGLSALTNEGNRVGQQLMGSVAQGLIGAKRKATGILSQAQTTSQFSEAGRAYELEHGVFGRRGLLDDVMDDEKLAASREFQRRFKAQTSGEGEFSSEGEEAGRTYETEGSGAEEIQDYFGEEKEQPQQETQILDPEALRQAGQEVETSTAETSVPPDLPFESGGESSGVESGFTTDATTDLSEEERDLAYDKLIHLKPKAQKKVFKRLQGQVKRSDFELETTKAELQSFKDLTDNQEQLEAKLQSLPVKKKIAEEAGRRSEVERLEQEYDRTLQDYQKLDLSGGNETDALLSDLNKSYYSGGESSGLGSSVIESALSDFESGLSVPASQSSLGESDLALLANTSFRGKARSDISVSEVDEPKPEPERQPETQPEPAPQTFRAVGRENIETIARKQKGKEELPTSKRLDAKLKKLDQDIKLIDSNFETDVETPEVRRGIDASLDVSRLLENEIPILEAELEVLGKDEKKLIEARNNADLFLLSLTGTEEQKEVYRKKNEGKDLPDVSSIPASKRAEMIAEYQRIIDETNELVKPYQRYRARIEGELSDTKGLLTTKYKGYIGTEYQQKFTTKANAVGAKVEAGGWDSYEKMILDQLVKEGKLSQEEADAINRLEHKRKQDVKQKLLDKAGGASTRRKWLYTDASTSATDGGWWKGYIKDARKDLARERGEVSVGRPKLSEEELQVRALENANQFETFARNL